MLISRQTARRLITTAVVIGAAASGAGCSGPGGGQPAGDHGGAVGVRLLSQAPVAYCVIPRALASYTLATTVVDLKPGVSLDRVVLVDAHNVAVSTDGAALLPADAVTPLGLSESYPPTAGPAASVTSDAWEGRRLAGQTVRTAGQYAVSVGLSIRKPSDDSGFSSLKLVFSDGASTAEIDDTSAMTVAAHCR